MSEEGKRKKRKKNMGRREEKKIGERKDEKICEEGKKYVRKGRGATLLFIYMYFSNFEMFFLIFLISNTFCKISSGNSMKNMLKMVIKITNFSSKEYSKNL